MGLGLQLGRGAHLGLHAGGDLVGKLAVIAGVQLLLRPGLARARRGWRTWRPGHVAGGRRARLLGGSGTGRRARVWGTVGLFFLRFDFSTFAESTLGRVGPAVRGLSAALAAGPGPPLVDRAGLFLECPGSCRPSIHGAAGTQGRGLHLHTAHVEHEFQRLAVKNRLRVKIEPVPVGGFSRRVGRLSSI